VLRFVRIDAGDPSKGFVPAYHFSIENTQGFEVGHLNFRVGDSDHVRLAAGHVGFAISEEHRGHGYAGDACLAIGPWVAEKSGQVLITTDPENFASTATLNRVGAAYRDEVEVPQGDPHFQRGSYRKLRFDWCP
jgi:tagatose 1,6-diphosphate aldolase